MKRIITILITLLIATQLFAQENQGIAIIRVNNDTTSVNLESEQIQFSDSLNLDYKLPTSGILKGKTTENGKVNGDLKRISKRFEKANKLDSSIYRVYLIPSESLKSGKQFMKSRSKKSLYVLTGSLSADELGYLRDSEKLRELFEDDTESAMIVDEFPEPLTVYYSDDPFLISFKRKDFSSSIILEIKYIGELTVSSDSELGVLDIKKEIEVFSSGFSTTTVNHEIKRDHIGYHSIFNLTERTNLLGHNIVEYEEGGLVYRKHEFILFPESTESITLMNPNGPLNDKVVINDIELQDNSSVDDILPDQILDVDLVSASVQIPKDKVLYVNSDCHLLVTKGNTRATFTLKHSGFEISFWPELEVEINYDFVPNVSWESTYYSFTNQASTHYITENSYFFGVPRSQVINSLEEYFDILLEGTKMGVNDYDPYKDDNLQFSIDQLKNNLEEDSQNSIYVPCQETDVNAENLSDLVLSSTFYFGANQNYLTEEGTGVSLKSDVPVSITFAFEGSLQDMVDISDIKIKYIALTGHGAIELVYENVAQVLLEKIVVLPGGKVLVDDAKLVGQLAEIQKIEKTVSGFFRGLLLLAIIKETGSIPPGASALFESNESVTGSLVQVVLEDQMRKAILDQIKGNSDVLLNVIGDKISEHQKEILDLGTIMGISE